MTLRPRVIPCLLLDRNRLVKTRRFTDPAYVGDPINAVRIFNDKEADELVILDITAGSSGRSIDPEFLGKVGSEAFMPVAYGGGIRNVADCRAVLSAGIEKVVLNNALFTNPGLIEEVATQFGSQAVTASIDIKRSSLRRRFGVYDHVKRRVRTDIDPVEWCRSLVARGAGELLVTSVDREGTLEGGDVHLIRRIATSVDVPVVAQGGVGSVQHISDLLSAGASAVACGTFFVLRGPHRAVLLSYISPQERVTLATSGSAGVDS